MRKVFLFAVLALLALSWTLTFTSATDFSKYNLRVGKKYLEENAQKEGVIVTPSGLQYKIIEQGTGTVSPSKSDTVKVHYRGTLINGKEFDSSYSRGEPASFGVGQVIKGWTEGLQLMHVGDIYEFTIPSELAYSAAGAGHAIGPHSVLNFKVELLEIVGKKEL